MKKTAIYTYLGTNGTVTTPVHLEGIYSVKNYRLEADNGKALTKDKGIHTVRSITVPEAEIDEWEEINAKDSSK